MAEENKTFVAFKRGLSNNLPSSGNVVNGTFYLTTDTNRLYVGNNNELAEINQYIITVDTFSKLPTTTQKSLAKGDFAYIIDENILAVCVNPKGTGTEEDPIWVQVNPDTNDNTVFTITEFSSGNAYKDEVSEDLIIPLTLKSKNADKSGTTLETYTENLNLTIPKSVFESVTIDGVSVSLEAFPVENENNKVLLKTMGAGAAGPGLNISSSGSVSVAYTPGTNDGAGSLAINGIDNDTKYNLVAESNQIKLKTVDGDGSEDIITMAAGMNIDIATESANKIIFSHETITETSSVTEKKEFSYEPITVLKSITTENGHITGYTPIELTLDDKQVSSIAVGANPGTIAIGSKTSDGTEGFITSDQILHYTYGKKDENGNAPYDAYNTEHLNVYSINEIDELMTGLNAMVYQKALEGQADFDETVSSGKVSKGYVYYISTSAEDGIKYYVNPDNPEDYKSAYQGDLLIANGDEGEDGYLTKITWEYVPSGDEVDTQYNFLVSESNKTITLAGTDNTANTIQFLEVEGADITVDVKPLVNNNTKNGTITIKHKEYTSLLIPEDASTTANPAFGGNFTVIDNIATTNGHVTGVNVKTVTLPSLNLDDVTYTFKSDTIGTEEDNNIKPVLRLENNTGTQQDIILNGDDIITVAAGSDNKSINISHKDYDVTESKVNKEISGAEFTAITSIDEEKGHITDYEVSTFTLPTYSLAHSIDNDNNKLTFSLKDNTGTNKGSIITLDTNSLSLTSQVISGEVHALLDLEWGSF